MPGPPQAAAPPEESRHGRYGLPLTADRRFRGPHADRPRAGARVNDVLANAVGGVLALLLVIYLFVALIRPERF
ncbi:K(+)-transporting ATPase subunit F [Actinokineospora sp. HBU206404]|uniref:K(+)-transporting ATPase subunit F n=1 Tax=Actinokineospora xionganensis TaxID=2684470 RepID=A0ABR7LEW9_9PSEU|nr:K(+)-transporting ATPase subunit F [Actinokineospora xionganensis]